MGKKSGPKPPDYKGAAEAQGASSQINTAQQTWANRPNQFSPWGAVTWAPSQKIDPGTGKPVTAWDQQIALNPWAQKALDAQMQTAAGRSQIGSGLMSRVGQELSQAPDWGQFSPLGQAPDVPQYSPVDFTHSVGDVGDIRNRAEQAIYSRATSRLDPQWQQREQNLQSQLVAQGLRPGDPAYQRAMENFNRERTDAYQTALNESIMGGGQEATRQFNMLLGNANLGNQASARELAQQLGIGRQQFEQGLSQAEYQNKLRQQQLSEELMKRGWSLNEVNALISGQQVGMPNMPGFQATSKAQSTPYLDAANMGYQGALNRYSTEQAGMQGLMSGLFGLGQAGLMGAMLL